jgi:hypothetical protein
MADKENLVIGILLTHQIEKGLEVSGVVRELVNLDAFTIRSAVPPMVKRIDSIAFGNEVVHYVSVASAVLGKAMRDQQYRLDTSLRQPALIIDIKILESFEVTFLVFDASIPPYQIFWALINGLL